MLSLSLTDIVLYGREMSIWRWVGNFDACILLFIATSTTLSYKRKVNIDFSGDSIYSCNSVSKLDQAVYVLCMVTDNLYSVVYPTLFLMSWHHHFSKLKLFFSYQYPFCQSIQHIFQFPWVSAWSMEFAANNLKCVCCDIKYLFQWCYCFTFKSTSQIRVFYLL